MITSAREMQLLRVLTGVTNIVRAGEENPEQLAARSKRLGMSARGTFLICDIDVDNAGEFNRIE